MLFPHSLLFKYYHFDKVILKFLLKYHLIQHQLAKALLVAVIEFPNTCILYSTTFAYLLIKYLKPNPLKIGISPLS